MKDIKVRVEKITRNRRKMIKKTADSLLLSKHSVQFSALFLLLSASHISTMNSSTMNFSNTYEFLVEKVQSSSWVGCAIIAQRVKIAFQPLHTSIRANWEFSSNCGYGLVIALSWPKSFIGEFHPLTPPWLRFIALPAVWEEVVVMNRISHMRIA